MQLFNKCTYADVPGHDYNYSESFTSGPSVQDSQYFESCYAEWIDDKRIKENEDDISLLKNTTVRGDYVTRTLWTGTLPTESQDPVSFELGTIHKLASPTRPSTYTIANNAWPTTGYTVLYITIPTSKLTAIHDKMFLIFNTDYTGDKPKVMNWDYPSDDYGWNYLESTSGWKKTYGMEFKLNGSTWEIEPLCSYIKQDDGQVIFGRTGVDIEADTGGIWKVAIQCD